MVGATYVFELSNGIQFKEKRDYCIILKITPYGKY
jgi:hypothetical protein